MKTIKLKKLGTDQIPENFTGIAEYPDGTKRWYKEGKRHRDEDGDLPAVVYSNGSKFWFKEGKHHRDGDLPAVVYSDGSKYWYKEGKLHRGNGKPAIVYPEERGLDNKYWINGENVTKESAELYGMLFKNKE